MTSLTPVLELEPWDFATREHERPSDSIVENPEAWFHYWSESLADSGIHGLTPWSRGSWFVSLEHLQDPGLLRLLLTNQFPEFTTRLDLDEIGPLNGGYILSHDGETIEPRCCGDLENLDSGRLAAMESTEA